MREQDLFVEGQITLKEEISGVPTPIDLRIHFPDEYPAVEPFTVDRSNLFPLEAKRHYCEGGVCCLWLPPESKWDPEDSNALLTYMDHVMVFFERQLLYDANGQQGWPWGERGHDIKGYIEYVHERLNVGGRTFEKFLPLLAGSNLPKAARCPCGSGRRYRFCHRDVVVELRKFNRMLKRSATA